jgi:hypothetical protein
MLKRKLKLEAEAETWLQMQKAKLMQQMPKPADGRKPN